MRSFAHNKIKHYQSNDIFSLVTISMFHKSKKKKILTRLSLFLSKIWWITKVFVSSKGTWVYIVREKPEVFVTLTLSLVIICRGSIERKSERERKKEWLCFSRTHLSRKSWSAFTLFAGRAFYSVIYLKYALKSYQGHDRALSAEKQLQTIADLGDEI